MVVRSDNGTEFHDQACQGLVQPLGIIHQSTFVTLLNKT